MKRVPSRPETDNGYMPLPELVLAKVVKNTVDSVRDKRVNKNCTEY